MTTPPPSPDAVASLHLIGSKIGGGAENFLERLVQGLDAAGQRVRVGVRPASPLGSSLAGSVPVHRIGMLNGIDVFSMWKIRRLVRRHDIRVVQSYMGRATRLTRLGGTGAVHVARLGNYYPLRAYGHCDAWIANTRGIRNYMIEHGFPPERIHHIYNFVEPPSPTPPEALQRVRARWEIPDEAVVIVSAGRFEPVKGFGELIDAFRDLPSEVNDRPVFLVLVGTGSLLDELREQVAGSGLGDRVRFTGWQDEPGPFYDLADLVVFPARKAEPFGNVILEAWAHRRPLLVTDFDGAREIVRPDEDAAMVACDDPAALRDAIALLLEDADRRKELAEAGRERLERDFSRERVVADYVELYRELVERYGR